MCVCVCQFMSMGCALLDCAVVIQFVIAFSPGPWLCRVGVSNSRISNAVISGVYPAIARDQSHGRWFRVSGRGALHCMVLTNGV